MSLSLRSLDRRLRRLARRLLAARSASTADVSQYRRDPAGYIRDVLGQQLTPDQTRICQLVVTPPYRVLVKAAHSVGKSFLAACLLLWWYDTHDPGFVLTTAPNDNQVKDIIWAEVRKLAPGRVRMDFRGPKMPRVESSEQHFAAGFTARDGTSFQGKHGLSCGVIFDEATGVEPEFWAAGQSMLGGDDYFMLAIFNPTDPQSEARRQETLGGWHVVSISALDHPNVAVGLANEEEGTDALVPFPAAVRLENIRSWIRDYGAEPLAEGEEPDPARYGDFEFPVEPHGPWVWLRPSPQFMCRVLGLYPRSGSDGVWCDTLIESLRDTRFELDPAWPVVISCDVARFGDDNTEIHVRKGLCSLHHEWHNGWDTQQTAGRLKQLCAEYGDPESYNNCARRIRCQIDVVGVGGGVVDSGVGYHFIGVNSAEACADQTVYRIVRDELWFGAAELAAERLIDVSRLPEHVRGRLFAQLLSAKYKIDAAGRRAVESKDVTKKRLAGASPDTADAFNLCWWQPPAVDETVTGMV